MVLGFEGIYSGRCVTIPGRCYMAITCANPTRSGVILGHDNHAYNNHRYHCDSAIGITTNQQSNKSDLDIGQCVNNIRQQTIITD